MHARRSLRLLVAASLAAAASLLLLAPAEARGLGGIDNGCVLATSLTPSAEVRPAGTTDPVESVARGFSVLHVSAQGTVTFLTVIHNPARETFFGGHIHVAPAGANGPIVVPLFSGSDSSRLFVQATTVAADPQLAAAICANPSAYYVNYHTTQDPQGAVRGQLG